MSKIRCCNFCGKVRPQRSFAPARKYCCRERKRFEVDRIRAQAALIASPGYLEQVMSKPTLRVNRAELTLKQRQWGELLQQRREQEIRRLAALDRAPVSELAMRLI